MCSERKRSFYDRLRKKKKSLYGNKYHLKEKQVKKKVRIQRKKKQITEEKHIQKKLKKWLKKGGHFKEKKMREKKQKTKHGKNLQNIRALKE